MRVPSFVLKEAKCWFTDYLNSTRAIPFSHADSIVSHAPLSLSAFVAQIPLPSSTARAVLKRTFRRFLTYHPVNEYDFFFESIGLPPSSCSVAASTYPSYFLSDDASLLAAVSALVHYGFPWTKLGLLYREEPRIFSSDSDRLISRLRALESRGFNRACIIGICLAFPSALSGDAGPGGEIDHLFQYLNKVFLNFDLLESVPENNVDIFLQVCRNIRVFYDLDSRKGTMAELMCKNLRKIFLELDDASVAQKLKFFIKLGMNATEAGHFILKHADIFNIDLENTSILMPEYLQSIGLDKDNVAMLSRRFPYVMGKNKLGNLLATMKAMNLHEWFLGKISNGGNLHYLSSECVLSGSHDTASESGFRQGLERLKSARMMEQLVDKKVEFMLSIGFGENKLTLRSISAIKGPTDQLQERFDCLLELGIEYSTLCRIVNAKPLILNQCTDTFHEKVNFLCNDWGYSLEYLENFPAFLCYGLENRTKPRFKMQDWLKKLGLLKKHLAPSTILSYSEREFMTFLYSVHPAAPKQWLECYLSRGLVNRYYFEQTICWIFIHVNRLLAMQLRPLSFGRQASWEINLFYLSSLVDCSFWPVLLYIRYINGPSRAGPTHTQALDAWRGRKCRSSPLGDRLLIRPVGLKDSSSDGLKTKAATKKIVAYKGWKLQKLQMNLTKKVGLNLEDDENEGNCTTKLFNFIEGNNCLLLLDDIWNS